MEETTSRNQVNIRDMRLAKEYEKDNKGDEVVPFAKAVAYCCQEGQKSGLQRKGYNSADFICDMKDAIIDNFGGNINTRADLDFFSDVIEGNPKALNKQISLNSNNEEGLINKLASKMLKKALKQVEKAKNTDQSLGCRK